MHGSTARFVLLGGGSRRSLGLVLDCASALPGLLRRFVGALLRHPLRLSACLLGGSSGRLPGILNVGPNTLIRATAGLGCCSGGLRRGCVRLRESATG